MPWGQIAVAGISALPGLISLFRGGRQSQPQMTPFGNSEYGKSLRDQMGALDRRIGSAYQDFSRVAHSVTPSISDLIGVSHARGGSGSVALAQRNAAMQQNLSAAYQGYTGHVDALHSQKNNLSALIGGYQQHTDNMNFQNMQHNYIARQNSIRNQALNAGIQGLFSLGGYAGSRWIDRQFPLPMMNNQYGGGAPYSGAPHGMGPYSPQQFFSGI